MPLCTDAKIIDMFKKSVLLVPENKVKDLPILAQNKIHQEVTHTDSLDKITVVNEIGPDDLGDKFQVIRNTTSMHRSCSSDVSQLVAKEMQFQCTGNYQTCETT